MCIRDRCAPRASRLTSTASSAISAMPRSCVSQLVTPCAPSWRPMFECADCVFPGSCSPLWTPVLALISVRERACDWTEGCVVGSRAHVDSKHAPSAKSTHKMLQDNSSLRCGTTPQCGTLLVHVQGSITPPHGGASPRSDAALPALLQGSITPPHGGASPRSDTAMPVLLQGSITPPHGGASPRSDAALPVHLQGSMTPPHGGASPRSDATLPVHCLLYTSDAADE